MFLRLSLLFFLLSSVLTGQVTDSLGHERELLNSKHEMFNRQDPNLTLLGGGAFYVPQPKAVYEVDTKKAYLWESFTPLTVELMTGDTVRVNGRLRLVDQAFEIMRPEGVFDLQRSMVRTVTTAAGRTFYPLLDVERKRKGIQFYELIHTTDDWRVLGYREAVWQDPPEQNMFDTRDKKHELKKNETFYLLAGEQATKLRNLKDLYRIMGVGPGSATARWAKRENIKLRGDEVRTLLAHHYDGQ